MLDSDLRILVLGAGSVGSRHARNLAALGVSVEIADPDPVTANAHQDAQVTRVEYDLDSFRGYDGIVLATPTSLHVEHALWALQRAPYVLVEKPLAVSASEILGALRLEDSARLMVGYNLRFHRPLQRFVELVHARETGDPLAVRAWFGSWLPDWRPTIDYRKTYSARAHLGGGILLDAIHEVDMLCWLLPGRFTVLGAAVDRLSDLDIDVEDTVKALLRHESGVLVELSLDYVSRQYRRGLEVTSTRGNLRLDWQRKTIDIETPESSSIIDFPDSIDDSYRREARCFVDWIHGRGVPPVLGLAGTSALTVVDDIRTAAR